MEYTFKWMNQGGIAESGMDKWIVTLRDDQGNLLKKIENSDATNLQNFSEVIIKMNLTYDEAMSQTATNTARVFFDEESTDTKIAEMNVLFDRTQVPVNIEDIATNIQEVSQFIMPIGAKFKCSSNDPFGSNNTYTYEHMGDNKIKYKPGESSTNSDECSKYTYTGVNYGGITSSGGSCGNNKRCPGAQCCSRWGWCGGQKGERSDWCSTSINISDNIKVWAGFNNQYDGIDIKNFNSIKTGVTTGGSSGPKPTRCGPGIGKCGGNECCGMNYYCGGSKPTYNSMHCAFIDWKNTIGFDVKSKGWYSQYDGDGTTTSLSTETVPVTSQNIVFRCATNDPLLRNNSTVYKWKDSSLKFIPSVPSGYAIYTLPNCDGIEYGGPG